MTEALYLTETDRREFEATVERTLDDRAVLDGTCFYPTGGGQPNDTGVLRAEGDEWRVTDVQKKDTVYHVLEPTSDDLPATPAEGTTVAGVLDWERRFAHMRYHTAQHLLSALLLAEYDARTTGNQLYDDHAHLDCEYERFDDDDLGAIERRMNELVDDARPVRWYTMDRETAEETLDTDRTRIHLLPDSITEVRIVEVGGDDQPYDRTACAGTHVENTEAIGTVRVTGRETKGRDEERVHFELE